MSDSVAFVGRSAELATLSAGLDEALAGRGRFFLLVGEAGIGKTRTAEELATLATARGARVAWGRCHEGEGAPSYWPWTQVLRTFAAPSPIGPGSEASNALLPGLLPDTGLAPPPVGNTPDASRFRLFDGIARFLRSTADETPLLVLLDDLHWADRASLLLLAFVARELTSARVLLVGTYREFEMRSATAAWRTLGDLARVSQRVRLRGFSEAEVATVARATCGQEAAPAVVAAIHRASDGNPFFVHEFVHAWRTHDGRGGIAGSPSFGSVVLPDEVRDVLRRRIDPLSAPAQRLLTIAAVIGRDFDLVTLAAVVDSSGAPLLRVVDEAVSRDLVEPVAGEPGRYRFRHAILRETLYDDLPAASRAALHRQIGEAIEGLGPAAIAERRPALAYHFFEAAGLGDVGRAVGYAMRAGELAVAQLAYEEAVQHFDRGLRALALGTPDDRTKLTLLLRLGDACWRSGDNARTRETLRRAADLARALDSRRHFALAALGYGLTRAETGSVDEHLQALLEEALDRLGDRDDALRASLMARLAMALYFTREETRRAELSRDALALARRIGDSEAVAAALIARHLILWRPGGVAERLAVANEIIAVADDAGKTPMALDGRFLRLNGLVELGDVATFDRELVAFGNLIEEARLAPFRWHLELLRAMRAQLAGRFDEAAALQARALSFSVAGTDSNATQFHAVQAFSWCREQERLGDLESAVDEFAARYPTLPIWDAGAALLHLERGRRAAAERTVEPLFAGGLADLPRDCNWIPALATLAEVVCGFGDAARARLVYEQLRPHAGQAVVIGTAAICWGSLDRFLGRLATTAGDVAAAIVHLETALQMNQRMGAHPVVAYTEVDLAIALERRAGAGDVERATYLRARATETARALGMPRLTRLLRELPPAPDVVPAPVPAAAGEGRRTRASLRREGDVWMATFAEREVRLKTSDGLVYLERLLHNPGRAVPVVELVGGAENAEANDSVALRDRVALLRERLADAEADNDLGRLQRVREEMAAVADELQQSTGLGGASSQMSAAANKARINVTRALTRTLRRLGQLHPELALYLETTVKTGFLCSYVPDARFPVDWMF